LTVGDSVVGRTVERARRLGNKRAVLEYLRIAAQVDEERRMLRQARAGRDVCWPEGAETDPLVTVRIATYNRGPLIAERALASAARQTYEHLEILVVGDACDDATAEAVEGFDDSRIRFVNLPTRGLYPDVPGARWRVAGAHPMNAGLGLARGQWLAPCDDDDELTPDHVEVLLREAIGRRLEMVHSVARCQRPDGAWELIGSEPLASGAVTHGSVLYSAGLRFMPHSQTSWKLGWPSDWDLWRRMVRAGVRIGFLDAVTYVHYAEARHLTGQDAQDG
jgi:hypothetical protein